MRRRHDRFASESVICGGPIAVTIRGGSSHRPIGLATLARNLALEREPSRWNGVICMRPPPLITTQSLLSITLPSTGDKVQ
ncbi:hypothetical protein CEXT_720171 [Caerostris extrusa]|uniref:Uncharacterized protein n=1 Tax=Caerostris extrusa TaxID=172846 RepID=A0AAV4T1U3_CAEEX|nr:hypothetical protein CEXT_720171 [Caerostris extrusa]